MSARQIGKTRRNAETDASSKSAMVDAGVNCGTETFTN